jgi:prepilin-type processing-associated H-X9-DG protein
LLVVIVIIGVLIGLLLPAVQAAMEASRRASCQNHLHQIGLGMQNYNSTFQKFPAAASLGKQGQPFVVHGWSFLVQILPYMEYGTLYSTLNMSKDPDDTSDPNHQASLAALNTAIKEFQCPSNPNVKFVNQDGTATFETASSGSGVSSMMLTNYKGMGASCWLALTVLVGQQQGPYQLPQSTPVSSVFPDGALFPGSGLGVADLVDGTAHTIMVCETIDNTYSRWTYGTDVTLVAVPNAVVENAVNTGLFSYYHPQGSWYDGSFNGQGAAAQQPPMRPWIAYNFSPNGGQDCGAYEDNGQLLGTTKTLQQVQKVAYGPSSGHRGSVNHLFADGSVQGISIRIDPCAIWFMTTRNGGDPYHPDAP